jgi:hypothetical protein
MGYVPLKAKGSQTWAVSGPFVDVDPIREIVAAQTAILAVVAVYNCHFGIFTKSETPFLVQEGVPFWHPICYSYL